MSFGLHNAAADTDTEVMHEINMTPLVDVMLVLLVIFIITVPVMKHAVTVALPSATSQPQVAPPETLRLSIDALGHYSLGTTLTTPEALPTLLRSEAAKATPAALHISADKAVRYEFVAQAMSIAQQAGLRKIGFVTTPEQPAGRPIP